MNKIYMTKRGHDGKTVVCSEKTRARGKVKSLVLAMTAASAMLASVDVVAATTLGENQTITDTTSVAIGNNVIATGADTVAVGDYTKVTGDESTALGERATTFGNQATATGSYAFADGNQSTSNGHASSAMAIDTIAIGVNSGAAGGSMSKEDWDKLIVIDREIKELDPSQFTKTVTTPGGEPDRTPVDEAKKVLDEALKQGQYTTGYAQSTSPSPMYMSLPDGGEGPPPAGLNIIQKTELTGAIADVYNKLAVPAGNLHETLPGRPDSPTTRNFASLGHIMSLAKESGFDMNTISDTVALAKKYGAPLDGEIFMNPGANPNSNSLFDASRIHYRDWLEGNGLQGDNAIIVQETTTMDDVEKQYLAGQEVLSVYKKYGGGDVGDMYAKMWEDTVRTYAQNVDPQVKQDALSALNDGLTQELLDKYQGTPQEQDFINTMLVAAAAKSVDIYSALPEDGIMLVEERIFDGISNAAYTLSNTYTVASNIGAGGLTSWAWVPNDYSYMQGFSNVDPAQLEAALNRSYESAKAIIQARQDAQAAYDQALAEYEAAVAAGGTGGTTTTTTDLAAYEAALAEKRAELTKLANAAGFDGTFESLSDVFGSKAGRAIAIGNSAYVSGDESVGVGYGNKVTGNQANVFGTHNTVTGDNNNVVGNNNTVATAGNNILGNAVTFAAGVATVGNVALGNDSVIGAAVPTKSVDIRGTTYDFAGTNPTSVVTVGSAGNERQITNVAAGQVTATSTDAINGSQLYAVVKAVEDLEAGSADTNTDKSVRVNGSDLVTVTNTTGAADGITTMTDYTVSINKGTFDVDPATGEVTAPTDGVATTADVADAINSGSFVVTAGGTKLADVGFGDTLNFFDGNGTKAIVKNGGVAYDLNVKSTDGSIVTTPNTDGSLSISVNTSVLPKTVVAEGKGIDVTPVTNGNTTTYTVAVDDTIADKQYVADEIAKIKIPEVDLSGLITYEESVIAGDNITVSQDSKNATGGKEFKVSLNSTLTGVDKIGGGTGAGSSISFGDNTINAGGSTISNIANPTNATDAATKQYVDDKATTVAKGDGISVTTKTNTSPSGAVSTEYTVSLDDATKAQLAKEESVSAGSNIVVKQDTKNATGGNNYNVSLASDLTGIQSISNGDTTVKLGDGAVNVGGSTITNVASPVNATDAANKAYVDNSKTTVSKGEGITVTATPSTKDGATSIDYNVALDDATKATLSQVQVNKDAITKGINTTADDGKVTNHPLGGIVAVLGDSKNIKTVTTDTGAISVQMSDNLKVNSVVIEGTSVGMGAGGISAGGNKIYNVAPGTLSPSSMDSVNGSQLYATNMNVANNAQNIGMLKERMDEFDDALDAQAAGARAALGIPQVTLPGKSMVGVGLGNYGDAQALAVGFSRLSDNARTILKGSIDANTKDTNKFGVSLGLGFQW